MNRVDCLEVTGEGEIKLERRNAVFFLKRFLEKLLDRIANLAIFLDVAVGVAAGKVFNLIPKGIQESLRRLNSEYLQHRNRLLNIKFEEASSTSSPLAQFDSAKHDSAQQDSAQQDSAQQDSAQQDSAQQDSAKRDLALQRGDVPGWVLVVLMTTGLVTALWTIAAPRLSQILRNSLDSMNGIR
jgi:hypothetical protein